MKKKTGEGRIEEKARERKRDKENKLEEKD